MEFSCPHCNWCFHLSPQNTDVYSFTASTKHNFAEIGCDECDKLTIIFFDIENKNLMNLLTNQLGCSNTRVALPNDDVREAYAIASGFVEVAKEYELSPRMEEEIAALAAALDAMPDDVLADLMATPPPKSTMPRRWA